MGLKSLLTIDTAANLESLRAANGLTNGLEYHDSSNGIRYLATSVSTLVPLDGIKFTGEFFAYNEAIPLQILVADTYHPIHSVTAPDIVTGICNNWTFEAGRVVDANITSEASGTGGKLRIICSAAHSLVTGDLVVLTNMNNAAHNKPTLVTIDGVNPTTEFLCANITYVAGAGTSAGVVNEPSQLIANSNAAGIYLATVTINGTAANANKVWKFEVNTNLLANDNIVTERFTTNSLATMTCSGIMTVAAGDKVWVSGKNITDTTDYTIKHLNLNLVKI